MRFAFTSTLSGTLWIALAVSAMAQISAPAPVNLLETSRNMAVLNDQNLGERQYIVPPPSAAATQFSFTLKGYVFGIRLVRANFTGYVDERDYAAYTDVKTSGLGALLKSLEIWSVTRGRVSSDGDLRPDFTVQQNLNKKNRRVEMNYDHASANVDIQIVPPNGSFGTPPATRDQQYLSYDAVTALLQITRKGRQSEAELCQGSVPVFDSKQHYNLRLEPAGPDSVNYRRVKYLGKKQRAIHCHIYYEPVSGFDPEDLPSPEEAQTPISVYFRYAEDAQMHVPVRFTYKISGFTAVVKLDEFRLIRANTDMSAFAPSPSGD